MRGAPLALLVALLLPGCYVHRDQVPVWPFDAPVTPPLEEPPPPGPRLVEQYVVLLPDDDGTVGAISVSDGERTVVLDEAYQAVDFDNLDAPYRMEPEGATQGFRPAVDHLPPAPTSYTVFFEYGSADLTSESQQAMASIVENITRRSAPAVRLEGHCDRAGTRPNNEAMSQRRAEAVRDLILAAGVASDLVLVEWFGEARPAVDTADGVREPRNRRVEIRVR